MNFIEVSKIIHSVTLLLIFFLREKNNLSLAIILAITIKRKTGSLNLVVPVMPVMKAVYKIKANKIIDYKIIILQRGEA